KKRYALCLKNCLKLLIQPALEIVFFFFGSIRAFGYDVAVQVISSVGLQFHRAELVIAENGNFEAVAFFEKFVQVVFYAAAVYGNNVIIGGESEGSGCVGHDSG